uniref:Uncharacterized protein n=1 Tax=Megaselia scalaris TaxID=36166 RepID=T1GCC3_MEGSC
MKELDIARFDLSGTQSKLSSIEDNSFGSNDMGVGIDSPRWPIGSQNDSLRAEIEAQTAAHKAQIGTLENRAHETWLAARQSERKYEEARLEGANLRRKLTQLSQNGVSQNTTDGIQSNTSINSAPSPVHMEAPGSPILQLPPPPPFLPPSFMGLPPPPMMGPGGAPPPFPPMFLPPGEIRPPPLGRLMSPPPHHHSRYIDDGNSILDEIMTMNTMTTMRIVDPEYIPEMEDLPQIVDMITIRGMTRKLILVHHQVPHRSPGVKMVR